MTKSQNQNILDALQTRNGITALDALQDFGCFRLAARIAELRANGYAIKTRTRKTSNGKRVAEYYL